MQICALKPTKIANFRVVKFEGNQLLFQIQLLYLYHCAITYEGKRMV